MPSDSNSPLARESLPLESHRRTADITNPIQLSMRMSLAGAAYLIYLGITTWRAAVPDLSKQNPGPRSGRIYTRALLVCLTNPGILMFYGAFFPQFMTASKNFAPQMVILCVTFLAIAIVVDANQPLGSEERLTRWGLMPFVSVCIASAEVGIAKPDPAVFDLALRQAGCGASEALASYDAGYRLVVVD